MLTYADAFRWGAPPLHFAAFMGSSHAIHTLASYGAQVSGPKKISQKKNTSTYGQRRHETLCRCLRRAGIRAKKKKY